jgi:hypothetical protein
MRVIAIAVFTAIFVLRMSREEFPHAAWFMDDGMDVANAARLNDISALDVQLMVREIPRGALHDVAAAFAGTPGEPVFPSRIVRVVRAPSELELPDGWSLIHESRGNIGTSDIDAWTHPEEAEICPEPPTGDPCMTLTPDDFRDIARSAGGLLHRVFGLRIARSATQVAEWNAHGARSLLWKIPMRAAGPDATRVIVLSGEGEQLIGVDGTRTTARGDRYGVAERPAPGAVASVTVRTPLTGKYEAGIPPLPIELRENELDVLRPMLQLEHRG